MNVGTIRGKLLKVVVITVVCDVTSDVGDQTRHRGEEGIIKADIKGCFTSTSRATGPSGPRLGLNSLKSHNVPG